MHLYTFNYRQKISIAWLGSYDANSSHSLPFLKAESYLKLSVTRLFWNCNYFPLQSYTMKHLPTLKPPRAQPACKNRTKNIIDFLKGVRYLHTAKKKLQLLMCSKSRCRVRNDTHHYVHIPENHCSWMKPQLIVNQATWKTRKASRKLVAHKWRKG